MTAPRDTQTTVVMIVEDGSEVPVERLDPGRAADLTLVDALMRLQLAARRRGWRVGVRGATPELRGLLELTGLAGVLDLEAGGQAERREQPGVDEVVQPADPPV